MADSQEAWSGCRERADCWAWPPGLGRCRGENQSPERGGQQGWQVGRAHPDVLQVLAVDGVDDAVGANELHGAVDVHIDHRATLAVLRGRRHPGPGRRPAGSPGRPGQDLPQATPTTTLPHRVGRGTHSGAHVPDHIPGHHGAVL